MKLIIDVIGMPKNCDDCNYIGLMDVVGIGCPCKKNWKNYSHDERPTDCPLKEAPDDKR